MKKLQTLLAKYQSTGRIAFHYPRLKRISLNGSRSIPEKEAIQIMQKTIS